MTVDVFNGTGRAGLAGTTATALRTAGFGVGSTGNADRRDYARTEIRYDPSREAQARTLAAAVAGAALVERAGIGDSVQLVLGSGFAGVKGAGGGSGSTGAAGTTPAGSGGSDCERIPDRRRHQLHQLGGAAGNDRSGRQQRAAPGRGRPGRRRREPKTRDRLVVGPGQAVAGRPDDQTLYVAHPLQVGVEGAVQAGLVGRELAHRLVVAVAEVVPVAGSVKLKPSGLSGLDEQ